MTDVFAITTRGLEPISAVEMGDIPSLLVKEVAYRRVTATYEGSLSALLGLRTVDDIFLDLATWPGIITQRLALSRLRQLSEQLDLVPAVELISRFRHVNSSPSFSVTANFVGRRNYSSEEIKAAVAEGIVAKYHWAYGTEDTSTFNIRIFLEHELAYVGMRLSERALHSRLYKQTHISGSLKPSVAAAMLCLARIAPRIGVLDPCCGAGTILIEAALLGAKALGGDNNPLALQAAADNARQAGLVLQLHRWNAQRLPLLSQSVDRVVTNLPWGRQITVDETLASFYLNLSNEFRRVLAPGGRIVALTSLPEMLHLETLKKESEVEISLYGQTPSILVFSSPG